MDYLNWVVENYETIGIALAMCHGFAVAVVNLTPTPADDILLGKLYRIVEAFAGILTETAKQPALPAK